MEVTPMINENQIIEETIVIKDNTHLVNTVFFKRNGYNNILASTQSIEFETASLQRQFIQIRQNNSAELKYPLLTRCSC